MSKLLTQCEGDVGRLDSQLEYKDYAPLFEAPANSKVPYMTYLACKLAT